MKNKYVRLTIAVGMVGFLGCVSSGKYKMLESQNKDLEQENQTMQVQLHQLSGETEMLAHSTAQLKKEKDSMAKGYNQLVGSLQNEVNQGNLKIRRYKNMLKVDAADNLFFKSGQTKIRPAGKKVLLSIAETINAHPSKVVRIGGHTDNIPPGKKVRNVYETNWELSAIRATNVVRFLQEKGGVSPERMAAVGHGEFMPIAENNSSANRAKNRRIEISLIEKEVLEELKESPK